MIDHAAVAMHAPWDEDARSTFYLQFAEELIADKILQWFSRGSFCDQSA
jgi:hypothetical protein